MEEIYKMFYFKQSDSVRVQGQTLVLIFFLQNCIIYRYYDIKRLVVTSLEDITKKIIVFMVATLNNNIVSTDRD